MPSYINSKLSFLNFEMMNIIKLIILDLQCFEILFLLETTWKQARIETLKVHEMEQLY